MPLLDEPAEDPRREALDAALRQALLERASLATGSPDAEAIALRRLIAETPPRQRALLKSAWGRLSNGARPLAATSGEAAIQAADRFGLQFRVVAGAEAGLKAAEGGSRVLIELNSGRPWWGRLLLTPGVAVTAALPDDRHGRPTVLVIEPALPGPTGDDRTFWTTDDASPNSRIVAAISDLGFGAEFLHEAGGLKLFMLAGYVQHDDPRLADAPGRLTGVIGAAPIF